MLIDYGDTYYGDTSFRVLAVVVEGIFPIRNTHIKLPDDPLFPLMYSVGTVQPLGTIRLLAMDDRQIQGIVYEKEFPNTPGFIEGYVDLVKSLQITVQDKARFEHVYPDLKVGNYPWVEGQIDDTAATLSHYTKQGPRRTEPQVIMTGFSPMLIDIADSEVGILAIVRSGQLPIKEVSIPFSEESIFIMVKQADLPNGDELYKSTVHFARGSIPIGSSLLEQNTLNNMEISIIDKAGKEYLFPFLPELRVGNYPEIPREKRAAILVHPRGQGTGYKQAVSIEFMAQHVYRTLQARGYNHNDIYFLSYNHDIDINGDGKRDFNIVDGPMTTSQVVAGTSIHDLSVADIQQAFSWAKEQGKLSQPLLVVFVDHADERFLRLDPFDEILTAPDFKALLDDYQQTTDNKVITILEACHTGTFINDLAAPNRLIITSTDEDKAYYDQLGNLSFLTLYFNELRHGEDFHTAFQRVSANLPTYGHPFNLQIPQLEDNGDGHANTPLDGQFASQFCLNGCFGVLAANITLEPQPTTITDKTLPLQVKVGITGGNLKRVWASITTPEVATQRNAQGFALKPSPVVELVAETTETENGEATEIGAEITETSSTWIGQFNGFNYQGDYTVTFMAEDQEGFITSSAPRLVHYADGPTVPVTTIATPISAKAVYHNGETLRVTLPSLPEGETQYVGMALPNNSGLFVLSELNQMIPFDGTLIPAWQGGEVMVELPIVPYAPRGEYSLYLLRLPAGLEPLAHPEQWMLGITLVKVE
jgi:hypothetical protein